MKKMHQFSNIERASMIKSHCASHIWRGRKTHELSSGYGQDLGRKKRKKLGYFKPEPLCAGTTTASRSSWGRNKGECLDTVRFRSWVRLGRLLGGGREEKHLWEPPPPIHLPILAPLGCFRHEIPLCMLLYIGCISITMYSNSIILISKHEICKNSVLCNH